MPFQTTKEKATQAFRSGHRGTIYDMQRDPEASNRNVIRDKGEPLFPFVAGSSYKGEWAGDMKDGLGTMVYPDGSKYEGEWAKNKRDGKGTLWMKKGKLVVKLYVGNWKDGKLHGDGVYNYENKEVYTGEWAFGKRYGSGRLDYPNGDYYIGSWENDYQKGFGTLYLENGNIFEGLWQESKKDGPGRFFYASTRKVYEGEWVNDQPKCGEYRDPRHDETIRFGKSRIRKEIYTLPELGLEDAKGVMDISIATVRLENALRRGISSGVFDSEALDRAKVVFSEADISRMGLLSLHLSSNVFESLGVDSKVVDMREVFHELDIGMDAELSFPEIVDIAMYIHTNMSQA